MYVSSRMNVLAPNLSAIVGTTTAAKLLGVAGGLGGLAKMPACNVHVSFELVSQPPPVLEYPLSSFLVHRGRLPQGSPARRKNAIPVLYTSPNSSRARLRSINLSCNEQWVPKVFWLLEWIWNEIEEMVCSCSITLTSRGVTHALSCVGGYGAELREKIEKHLDRLTAPPPSKVVKALAIPNDGPKKRRGGRRCVHNLTFFC